MTESHFTDIELHIVQELMLASRRICVAVAWLTNPNLLRVLTFKRKAGVQVEIVLNSDENNKQLDFSEFINYGGIIYWVKMTGAIMHNKFCIIDDDTILHGSYNWTLNAENRNEEQISICKDEATEVSKYKEQFQKLKEKGEQEQVNECDEDHSILIPYRVSRLHGEISIAQQKLIMAIVKFLQPQIKLLNDTKRKKFRMSSLFTKYDNNTIALDIPFKLIHMERVRHDSYKTVAKKLAYEDIRYPKEEGRGITILSEPNIFPKIDYNMVKGMPTTIKLCINARELDNLFSLDKGYITVSPRIPELFAKKRSLQTYLFLKRYEDERIVVVGYNNIRRLYGVGISVPEKFSVFKRDIMDIVKKEFDELFNSNQLDLSFDYAPIYPDNKDKGIPNEIEFKLKVKL